MMNMLQSMKTLLGKTECWYVLQADEGTRMVMGHHAKPRTPDFIKAMGMMIMIIC